MTTVPAAPPQNPRRRRYPMTTVSLARRMYGDGDSWTPTQIQRYLQTEHGLDVTLGAVRYWVVPGLASKWRAKNTEGYHRRQERRTVLVLDTVEARMERLRALRDAALSHRSIAAVMAIDTDAVLTSEDVRALLGRSDRKPSRRMLNKLMGETT